MSRFARLRPITISLQRGGGGISRGRGRVLSEEVRRWAIHTTENQLHSAQVSLEARAVLSALRGIADNLNYNIIIN